MTEERTGDYEGLFLYPQSQSADLQGASGQIQGILEKAGAELISLRKWDERKLAYDIKGNKRGVYFLAYFRAPARAMGDIERDCNLSESMLRWMITRADHLTRDQMEAADGRAELADEAKLREEKKEEQPRSGRDDAEGEAKKKDEAVTVETEASQEAAARSS